ncbi:GFA family protein, partial [Rhizobiaceae sp. 2RAB30]
MPFRTASCSCGGLSIQVEGEPLGVGVCHCLACQRRTG